MEDRFPMPDANFAISFFGIKKIKSAKSGQ